MPSDLTAERRWTAGRYLAMLAEDVAEIEQTERLAHHLLSFLATVREWQAMARR